jgi:N-methylhydantoinase A
MTDSRPASEGAAVAVDVGGTFIDLVMVDPSTGEVSIEKQPATPDALVDELLTALRRLPRPVAEIDRFIHGATVAINTLVQRRGAHVGLITTFGFRDVLELGRGNRPAIYDWLYTPPDPLVPRYLRREVHERAGPDGAELLPLDVDELVRETGALVDHGVEAIAVCFLHAYAASDHERLAGEVIRERYPDLHVTLSSDAAPEWREFERTSTAVVNAYVQPRFSGYVRALESRLAEDGLAQPIAVMQSNGGVMAGERAIELPVRTLASGPAGGVIGVEALARELAHPNAICADVGGTTYDVAIIEEGRILERTQTEVDGRPVLAPTIDIVSVGAGGGSIARIDEAGALVVGPQSAGARPGPVCFGLGGEEPTVADCHVVLGLLDPERFLGGRMKLDPGAAEQAIRDRIAAPLDISAERAADGVLRIAETNMAHAIHSMTVERGVDPREFVLYSYGGGGGLFAAATANELGIPTVLVPRAPATFAAGGILASDYREDSSTTQVDLLTPDSMTLMWAELNRLQAEVVGRLAGYGFDPEAVEVLQRVDLRFKGQEHTVTVALDPVWAEDPDGAPALRGRFVDLHRRLYGHGDPDASVEVVTLRCRAIAGVGRTTWPMWDRSVDATPRTERPVFLHEALEFRTVPVFDREGLAAGQRVDGPAIVEESYSTVLVPPEWSVVVDELGNLVMGRVTT